MNLRSFVATSTLAALLALPLLGQNTHVADRLAHWAFAWGMSGIEAMAFAAASSLVCLTLTGPGVLACSIASAG